MARSKETTYRDHKIWHDDGEDGGFAALFGGDWYSYSGPIANGGGDGGVRGAKRSINDAIRWRECGEATKHANREERPTNAYLDGDVRVYCKDCGKYLGYPPRAHHGAHWTYWRKAANGHVYGYNTTKDELGKWYAVDRSPGHRVAPRFVKCSTRAKAKAKATDWWRAAEAKRKKRAA